MFHRRRLILTPALLASACSYVNTPNNNDGETGGEVPLNEGPQEVSNPPEWVCRERAPKVTLAGHDQPIPEIERCYYSPHSKDYDGDGQAETEPWGWPGKPHWRGLPTVMHWIQNFNPMAGHHPTYVWHDPNLSGAVDGWDDPDDGWTLHNRNAQHPWLPEHTHDFRSGLIGNFALWIGGVPSMHPRPPIVTASFIDVLNPDLPTIIGHPFYEGRYNAFGVPCSTTPPNDSSWSHVWSDVITSQFKYSTDADCQAWVEWYGVQAAHPNYPMINSSDDVMMGIAQDGAQCLDNGGVYKVSEAALTAVNRNGLIWINWGEFWEDFVLWIQTNHPEVHALIVALDYLQGAGWESWPTDPPYPYNNWSVTGVCSHPVTLRIYENGTVRTSVPCPDGMVAELPEIDDVIELDEIFDYEEVHGYCTIPHQLEVPPVLADATPIDVITTARKGHGFDGAKYVDLTRIDQPMLEAWATAVTFTEGPTGIQVTATNQLGRDLLTAFSIPEGSRITGLNRLTMLDNPTTGEPGATAWDAAIEVDRAIGNGEFLFVLVDTPDRRKLHRYIVPVVGR